MSIGKQTKTKVCIAYIKGIANPRLIEEIQRRLKRINTDAILESGYIEQFIEDAPYSIFTQVGNSEKPDTIAAKLLEGRAAILVDGTPFVLSIPMLFIEGFQSAEDYYSRPYCGKITQVFCLYNSYTRSGYLCSLNNLSPRIDSYSLVVIYGLSPRRGSSSSSRGSPYYMVFLLILVFIVIALIEIPGLII